jgi:hypothetical protein
MGEAVVVPYREVGEGDWTPEVNKCHHNVKAWTDRNPHHVQVLGWLVVTRLGDDVIRFVAHSVVEDETGNKFDITPLQSTELRPFLEAGIDPDDFFEIGRSCSPHMGWVRSITSSDSRIIRRMLA